jgi:ATP-dependent helicase HrpB
VISLNLPVEDVITELQGRLLERDEVILQAPPGAGKTTLIPLALIDEPWLGAKKILMLEPRRLATRSAAYRMADLLNESPGQTIGYRMRLDTKVGRNTRIEVITEGIMTRMLQEDPSLEGVGLVIFDEFHERSLDSDLALSLCLKGRSLFRDASNPLKLLIMSATLDGESIATLLDDAPIITSEGRQYPVELIYGRASLPRERIKDRALTTIKQALDDNPGSSLLVFLPGQGEIRQIANDLSQWLLDRKISDVHLRPLFGNLSIEDQRAAIEPLSGALKDHCKVVLATNIAETSLTIEGVDVVIDSGLVREPVFDAASGMTRLQTVKISKSSSIQRMGRAGRLRPGKCYRLWSADQQQQLVSHSRAEITNADLAPMALQLLQWGIDDPSELRWLDRPGTGPWQQALSLLKALGAIEQSNHHYALTKHGQHMTSLPVHPRLAHLLIRGAEVAANQTAALLASFLSDRDPVSDNPDINARLDILTGQANCPRELKGWQKRTQQLARQFESQLTKLNIQVNQSLPHEQITGFLLTCAYPDRIARQRHSGGYQLANGRSANLASQHYLGKHRWLAVAEVTGAAHSQGDIIRSSVALDPDLFDSVLNELVIDVTVAEWNKKTKRFVAEAQQKIGALVLSRKSLKDVPVEAKREALVLHLQKEGLSLLPWTTDLHQWCARVLLVRSFEPNHDWPDVSQESLSANLASWLSPHLDGVNLLQDFKKLDLKQILQSLLPYELQQRLNEQAPERFTVPSGSSIAINYRESSPVLAVKLQEMFGSESSPAVVNGKVPLTVHLLSPAGRPLQITQDLTGFWRTSYHEVKKEMKGRYPKHPWPDDPLVASPTRRTKRKT